MSNETVVIEGFDKAGRRRTEVARMISLKGALMLEVHGLRRSRGSSALSVIKKELGFKGSKSSVLTQMREHVEQLILEGTGEVPPSDRLPKRYVQ